MSSRGNRRTGGPGNGQPPAQDGRGQPDEVVQVVLHPVPLDEPGRHLVANDRRRCPAAATVTGMSRGRWAAGRNRRPPGRGGRSGRRSTRRKGPADGGEDQPRVSTVQSHDRRRGHQWVTRTTAPTASSRNWTAKSGPGRRPAAGGSWPVAPASRTGRPTPGRRPAEGGGEVGEHVRVREPRRRGTGRAPRPRAPPRPGARRAGLDMSASRAARDRRRTGGAA